MTSLRVANEQMGMEYRDVWTTAYVNDLPDSAFLYIAPGGTKTGGRTDGAHRFFPVMDANGKPDAAHIRNALARIPQASSIPAAARAAAMAKAKKLAAAHPAIGSGPGKGYEGGAGTGRAAVAPAGLEFRSFDVSLEFRTDGTGRTLVGRAVPYGETTQIPGGAMERFMPGAFARQISGGERSLGQVKLYQSHHDRVNGAPPVARTASLAELADGLHGEWPLYNTPRADEALELVRQGAVTGLSIGFKALPGGTHRGADGAMERHSVHLDHVVLTSEPAYAGAAVMTVRSAGRPTAAWRTAAERHHVLLERIRV
jgi:HK97 family phage prohead protease